VHKVAINAFISIDAPPSLFVEAQNCGIWRSKILASKNLIENLA
jgi:hypothetical protein